MRLFGISNRLVSSPISAALKLAHDESAASGVSPPLVFPSGSGGEVFSLPDDILATLNDDDRLESLR